MAGRQQSSQTTKHRLEKAVWLISLLEQRREWDDDPQLGSNIERMIVDRELEDLEEEIALNPGPLTGLTLG